MVVKQQCKKMVPMVALALALAGAAMASNAIAQAPSAQYPRYRFLLDPAAAPAPGVVKLARAERYDAAKGYGFTDTRDGNEMALAVKAAPGDYRVRVRLAAPGRPMRVALWAEDRRLMAAPVALEPGEVRSVDFVVNVRDAALAKSEHDAAPNPAVRLLGDELTPANRSWDERLTVAVSGDAAAVQAIEIEPVAARRLFLAGDSTVTDQAGGDYASWGQMLPRFLGAGVAVANHARSGETMKSFVASLRWDKLLADARPGDIQLIQFGHNDQKKQWPRTYVSPAQAYPAWLGALVADARQRGLKVGLASSVSRRSFGPDGRIANTLAGYDDAVRQVAASLELPFIDLTARTRTLYEALGPQASLQAFARKGADVTHHNTYGAWVVANLVAQALLDPANGFGVSGAADFQAIDPARPPDPAHYEVTPADWPLMREAAGRVSGS
jgi:lysophospholipase L1-like esterase